MTTFSQLVKFGALLALSGAASALATPFKVELSAADPALTCGSTSTPTLSFSGTQPKGTKGLALIFWDQQPGALSGRWLVYDLPVSTTKLASGTASSLSIGGGKAAKNEAGQPGYTAICAKGPHDIYIDFYALDVASLKLPAGTPLQTLHAAIKRHKLLEAKAHRTWQVK